MQKQKFWKSQNGASAVEYSLIACFIALAIVGSLYFLGSELHTLFDTAAKILPATPQP
ncbi:Flp family type IVb pilin [Pseudochrobactrum algeriensis]|uniref:Flp family type IVb pilin n=1 Tax=Pseudochrobactrum algeriensis TaxID=2834768 RepID=UPI001BCCA0C6|nr:Flp family type IVb pilin [Pseudochrobactrum algeriensis]MBX8813262.1 Flp family type IVb pilin [Ochrobactrum sp. MR34]QVQ37867.1 Flp family type IVb pilin [Pseudochrobactrum algeriensis]QVQ41090.1 Flp family type IVb pilin [Pseudochrobactrum algeriensis]QVQ45013.1 Flp family type IVb pilin [Pseudochrobactrum algeriensis]